MCKNLSLQNFSSDAIQLAVPDNSKKNSSYEHASIYRADAFQLAYDKLHQKHATLPWFEAFYFVAGLLPTSTLKIHDTLNLKCYL